LKGIGFDLESVWTEKIGSLTLLYSLFVNIQSVNGKWIRPCSTFVPPDLKAGEEYVIQVKEVKSKAASSGKFYSFRSFIMGFWNNLLGMVGFVKERRAAKRNWEERREYEDMIKQRTLEKKRAKAAAAGGELKP